MKKYSDGNHQAFNLLYQRHKGGSYRYFLRQCHGHQEAEDLMQELWSRVIKSHSTYRETALFSTWFYRIAHNLLVDHHKHLTLVTNTIKPQQQDAIDHRASSSPEHNLLQQKQSQRFNHCLTKLPAVQLEAFLIKQETDLKIIEIAHIVDASLEATKSRLRYAIISLKQCLGELL
jgi:RNA polymerase sigma-70 factor (ECF subfamily)